MVRSSGTGMLLLIRRFPPVLHPRACSSAAQRPDPGMPAPPTPRRSPTARTVRVAQRGSTRARATASGCQPTSPPSSVVGAHRMKLDPIDESVLVDRPRVRGAVAQGPAVGLAGSPHIRLGDRRERDELDGVDLDQTRANPVAAALLDLWPLPQPD